MSQRKPPMTPKLVRFRVNALRGTDVEGGHAAEDGIYLDLLRAIAGDRCGDPVSCAKEAIKSQRIVKTRWYS